MFSIGKNGILNPLRILCIQQTFWSLIKTLNESMACVVLHKQTTCEMKTLQVQVYIQQWFYEEQGAKLSC